MYSSIGTSELKGLIGRVNIIDIRDNYIYRLGSIPSSKNIPANYLLTIPREYLNKNEKYYLYCSRGFTSAKVCAHLTKEGYCVVNVLGGYQDYIGRI